MSPLEGFSPPPPGRDAVADGLPAGPLALTGDVDASGEIVDALTVRLRAAIGFCSRDVDPDAHVALVRDLIDRVRR